MGRLFSSLHMLLLLIPLHLCCTSSHASLPADGESSLSLKHVLDRTDQQMNTLASRVVSLSERLDAVMEDKVGAEYKAKWMARTLDRKEGRHGPCKKRFFPCGDGPCGGVQCIHDYLVCDRHKDCKNGADEDPAICNSMLFEKPVFIPSLVLKDTCRTVGHGAPLDTVRRSDWNNSAANVIPWFPSRPEMIWTFKFVMSTTVAWGEGQLIAHAWYDYATGDIILEHDTNHLMNGGCTLERVSDEAIRYHCLMDNSQSVLDEGKEPCFYVLGRYSKD